MQLNRKETKLIMIMKKPTTLGVASLHRRLLLLVLQETLSLTPDGLYQTRRGVSDGELGERQLGWSRFPTSKVRSKATGQTHNRCW